MRAAFPVTIITAIVSPITLPMPSMTAASIPGRAAYATMRHVVCHFVAPMAIAASRYWRGTAVIASSAIETIVGIAIKASVIAPDNAVRPVGRLNIVLINGPSVIIPIKPITTEGIAARSSTPAFIISLVLRGAISAIKRALAIPIGMEIIPAPAVTRIEPSINGRIPN